MKKIFAAGLSVITALTMAACSAGSTPETTAEPSSQTETTAQTENTVTVIDPITITTMETETVIPDYVQSEDSYLWFEQVHGEWSGSGTVGTSGSDKVGTALYELSDGEFIDDMIFDASVEDCSPLRAQGSVDAEVTGSSIYKMSGDTRGKDEPSFYGMNAAIQALDGAFLKITNSQVNASAEGSTGVFAYNQAVIFISDSTVHVSGGGAGGVQVAGGGKLYAWDLTVTSESKAAIRSDRGGGVIEVNGGSYTSNGTDGCPAVYSTADITMRNAELTSNHSRAVIIEGDNSVVLENCITSGCDESTKEGSINGNVLLYQSRSGDADEGTGVLTVNGGSMTANNGVMFYCTNTSSIVNLNNVSFTYSDDGVFLRVSSGRWGDEGKNGGSCVLNAKDQDMQGDIMVDEISSLEMNMTDSEFEGAINPDGSAGYVKVVMDGASTWKLTADSYITEFDGDLTGIDAGNFHLYVDGKMIK